MTESILRLSARYLTIAALSLALIDPAQPGAAGDTPLSAAPTCSPDADLSGLFEAVKVTLSKLDGLDREAVSDLMAVVGTYRDERAAICEALAQANIKAEVAEKTRQMEAALSKVWEMDASRCHEALKTLPARRALPFGWTAGFGGCVDGNGNLSACAAGIFGWRF